MVWRKVRVPHRRLQILMAQDALQGQDVAAIDHEVASEGVPQGNPPIYSDCQK